MVLGAADAGKSTFCNLLLRHAAGQARASALLDADLAQKLCGPPACVTLCRDAGPPDPALAFVGTLDPLRGWHRLVEGTGRLAGGIGRDTLLVVNTDGLLRAAGRRLKAAEIAAVGPDLLVALGEGPELEAVLRDGAAIPTLRLPRSPLARRKTEGERRALRRAAFRRYFSEAQVRALDLRGLRQEGEPPSAAELPGCLVALVDAQGRDLAIGIALSDAGPAGLTLRAPVPASPPAWLRWGGLRLNEDFADRPRGVARC